VNKQKYISDLITTEEIEKWNSDKIVFIEAPTGKGKSHFIKHILSQHNNTKKILILVNRTIIKKQSEVEIGDNENITIKTYQHLSEVILTKSEKIADFIGFDYIICDEAHHFCEESEFIFNTDVSFNWVINQNAIKIFMTATANFIKRYLTEKLKLEINHYYIENNYNFIEKLYFYENDDVIEKLLFDLPENEKAIYFTSAKKAYEMSKLITSSIFYCSKSNFTYHQYVDSEKITYIEENEMFEEQLLCVTKVMDVGANLIDNKIKHLIIDIADLTSIVQCIGRKRIKGNEKIILYIKDKKGNSISRKLESIKDKLTYANILLEKGEISLIEEYSHKNTYGNLIYDIINRDKLKIEKKVNELMYYTYNENKLLYEEILLDKEDGFKNKLFERMGIENMKYTYLEKELDKLVLEDILNKLIGIKMFKEQQKEFKEMLLKRLLNSPKGSHGSIGLKTINALFEENNLKYEVNSDKENSRKSDNYKKMFWTIIKLTED